MDGLLKTKQKKRNLVKLHCRLLNRQINTKITKEIRNTFTRT